MTVPGALIFDATTFLTPYGPITPLNKGVETGQQDHCPKSWMILLLLPNLIQTNQSQAGRLWGGEECGFALGAIKYDDIVGAHETKHVPRDLLDEIGIGKFRR